MIPVKNDASQLEGCLRLLVPQLSFEDEVIVVDNGSSDSSARVAESFGATVLHESVPGIAAASAAGYDAAAGRIIGRLDADSRPAEDWVETVVQHFDRHPTCAAITGTASFTDGPASLRRVGAFFYLGPYFLFVSMLLGHTPLFGSNCAFRREEWARVRHHVHSADQLVHDDMDLSFHIGPLRPIHFLSILRVGISARPFHDGRGVLRARRAFHTMFIHWPTQLPWIRLGRRIIHRLTIQAPGVSS